MLKRRFYCTCTQCQCNIIVAIPTLRDIERFKAQSIYRNPEWCTGCNNDRCIADNKTANPRPRTPIEY